MEFHSIVYYLKNESGHFYHYHVAVQKCMESLGLSFHAHLAEEASLGTLPTKWERRFPSFHKSKSLFFHSLRKLFRTRTKEPRIFFLEFFKRKDFTLFAFAALLFLRSQDRIWLLYRDDLTTRSKRDQRVIRILSQLLQWKCKERFVALTDSDELASYYQKWFRRPVEVLPIMHTYYASPSFSEKGIALAWPGSPRSEKGLSEVQALVQLEDPYASQFSLSLSEECVLPAISNGLKLERKKAHLSEEEYFSQLQKADLILLPYDENYKWRTSGIFVETIAGGKMPIVKEGSWLASELLHHDLPELILAWNAPLLFSKMHELFHNQEVRTKLLRMQEHYRSFHSEEHFRHRCKELI